MDFSYDWFAGLVDGEGSFGIYPAHHILRFTILLRDADQGSLEMIRDYLGVGHVHGNSMQAARDRGVLSRDCCTYQVNGLECPRIVDALDGRLRTRKRLDFDIWKQAVRAYTDAPRGQRSAAIEPFKDQLEEVRR